MWSFLCDLICLEEKKRIGQQSNTGYVENDYSFLHVDKRSYFESSSLPLNYIILFKRIQRVNAFTTKIQLISITICRNLISVLYNIGLKNNNTFYYFLKGAWWFAFRTKLVVTTHESRAPMTTNVDSRKTSWR